MTTPAFKNELAEQQWQKASALAATLAKEMVSTELGPNERAYRPPASDDPETWTGMLRWCYVERVYRWVIDRATDLQMGGGPYYCPARGASHPPQKRPGKGWQARGCMACAWDDHLYDETLALARWLGRKGKVAA